ncbi:HNH endonuclease [Bacteriovorax stolpii]|uniref:Uncharacterized protein n=1 Tax=Bacteriovorax stolpii TaxID=960 RepID=A0A2K9NVI0_BACTC|nr:HNH endonuclease signature motif containing protein [Bacteriovorax stolpii]AUN98774.1 hypothetical protein C0V70_11820 [Bacteriovorax stolpii]QDK41229.1 HNH endonuclease [Bacteriovorax stolpii]TDP55708.1 HNH endonuclease [Bacteriovorax stolpii]
MSKTSQLIHKARHFKFESLLNEEMIVQLILCLVLIAVSYVLISSFYYGIIYPLRQKFKKKNEHGYVLSENGNFEHREIVEKIMKRKLRPGEEVHHINGVKWDNRKSNLALMTREEHLRWHKRLEWMWSQRMRPSIRWQKMKLQSEFGAILF